MAIALAPVAGIALRYGAVALAAYVAARRIQPAHFDQRAEEALDDVPEGLSARRDPGQAKVTAGYCRIIRVGRNGPGLELRAHSITRFRVQRV